MRMRGLEQRHASSAACVAGDRRRQCDASRAARAHARAAADRSSDRAGGRRGRSTARRRGARSSRAARRSTRPRPPRSHRGARCGRRSGNSETARAAAGRARAAPRQTSRRPGASWCRGCACRPSALPSDRDTLAPPSSDLEAQPAQRRLLRVADAGFDFALAIGIADAARQRDDAVVREHVAVERIERRIVDVGREDAFFEIVEDDRRATVPPSRRNARSWSSAQTCVLDCHTSSRTALRE